MTKAELINELHALGIEADDSMKVAELKQLLENANSETPTQPQKGMQTLTDAIFVAMQNKYGEYKMNKEKTMREFVPATKKQLIEICADHGHEVETKEEILEALQKVSR